MTPDGDLEFDPDALAQQWSREFLDYTYDDLMREGRQNTDMSWGNNAVGLGLSCISPPPQRLPPLRTRP